MCVSKKVKTCHLSRELSESEALEFAARGVEGCYIAILSSLYVFLITILYFSHMHVLLFILPIVPLLYPLLLTLLHVRLLRVFSINTQNTHMCPGDNFRTT